MHFLFYLVLVLCSSTMVCSDGSHTISTETTRKIVAQHLEGVDELDNLESIDVLWVHVSEFLKATAMVKLIRRGRNNKSDMVLFTLVYTPDGWRCLDSEEIIPSPTPGPFH